MSHALETALRCIAAQVFNEHHNPSMALFVEREGLPRYLLGEVVTEMMRRALATAAAPALVALINEWEAIEFVGDDAAAKAQRATQVRCLADARAALAALPSLEPIIRVEKQAGGTVAGWDNIDGVQVYRIRTYSDGLPDVRMVKHEDYERLLNEWHAEARQQMAAKQEIRRLRQLTFTSQPGTPVDLGERLFSFADLQDWADNAQTRYREASASIHTTAAIDAKGRLCNLGMHFHIAAAGDAFPVTVYRLRPDMNPVQAAPAPATTEASA